MCTISADYIQEVLLNFGTHYNLKNLKYTLFNFESIAQNYFGVLFPVQISGQKDNKDVIIDAVLKLAPNDERYRVSGAIAKMFAREIYVYSVLLNKYAEYKKNMPNLDFVIPNCFYVSDKYCNEVIIMQNMCIDGYQPLNTKFLNLEHIKISLESLAHFHALSFVLEKSNPKLYRDVKEICVPLNEVTNKRYMEILDDRLDKALMKFADTTYVALIRHLKDQCVEFVRNAVNSVNATCICHGDIWKENILFKYQNGKPVSACLIDYQTARESSPAFDVLYLISSSTNTELRKDNYYKLLDLYYETFSDTLTIAGFAEIELYTREMFDADLKLVAPACFIVANTALWLSNGLQQEGHVRSKIVLNTEEEMNKAVADYKSVIKNMIDDFYMYGYFCK